MKDCCYTDICLNCPNDCDDCKDYKYYDPASDYEFQKDPAHCLLMSQDCEFCYYVNYCYQTKKLIH